MPWPAVLAAAGGAHRLAARRLRRRAAELKTPPCAAPADARPTHQSPPATAVILLPFI